MTPGTSFAGTLEANGLTPSVPGMGWPGVLELGIVSVCARVVAAPYNKIATSRNVRPVPYLSLKEASFTAKS
jgi:hypothetical protein